ncbi:MAG: TIGR00730 family Rossman fold protein [Planctomycetia bacterium]|nr:TIGR00730 family Rossman fold protein [Planctomycetia bacterium]
MNTPDRPTSSETAYHNEIFMDSNDGRPLRILAEYFEPFYRLQREEIHDTIVFFGSARMKEDGPLGRYYKDARLLARLLTEWSCDLAGPKRFVVCSGGGGGIMEAANRGAADAGGSTIGFNIGLPHEQRPNPYVTPALLFEFHYFFMRKLWFTHLARALIVFPGGFGTLDEFMEMLTLAQTQKLDRDILILLYGSEYWKEVINFDSLVKHGMIDEEDLNLIHRVGDVQTAFELLKNCLPKEKESVCPAIAKAKFSKLLIEEKSR